jgi:hypothetical protein
MKTKFTPDWGRLAGQVKHLFPLVLVCLFFTGCQFAAIPTPTNSPPPHLVSIPAPGTLVEVELVPVSPI